MLVPVCGYLGKTEHLHTPDCCDKGGCVGDFMSPYILSKVQSICIQYYGLLQDVSVEVQTINNYYASVI